MTKPLLLPYPKSVSMKTGSFIIKPEDCLLFCAEGKSELHFIVKRLQETIREQLKLKLPLMLEKPGKHRAAVIFDRDDLLSVEEYRMDICPEHIKITYKHPAGAFHAISTLKQLILEYGRILPCMFVEDTPDFSARGIMLDISRNKIPTMETLYKLVDFMADFKLNQLQLYIEGFSFAYSTYSFVWQDSTPVTGEEILELDLYCKERHIELVPNQNSFGHMGAWLERNEFAYLAECPEGYEPSWDPGKIRQPETLDPLNPGSLELVEGITVDLLPYFTSSLINVGCDETFELGKGKSAEQCKKSGTGRVYLDYLVKVYEIAKKHGKQMMFWGDIIVEHPEFISRLPKDVIALEWGYEANHPFKEDGEKFRNAGVSFYVCPGTGSWNSIAGRTENMKANLLNAAVNGKENGSIGYLITDWGDHGHWQYLPFSYPGFVYGAALSWNVKQNAGANLAACLDRFVFRDNNNHMGRLILELGNYYLKEKNMLHNCTTITQILYSGFEHTDKAKSLSIEDFDEIKKYVMELEEQLCRVQMISCKADLIEDEFHNAVRFIKHGCDLGILKRYLANKADDAVIRPLLGQMIEEITLLIRQHEILWLSRNRLGGLNNSLKKLKKLKEEYESLYRTCCGRDEGLEKGRRL